jgi:NhaA family Na+:H+ antiporter
MGIMAGLPLDLHWRHVFGAGLVGGVGFTMSIFIANLAFPDDAGVIAVSKMAIIAASVAAGFLGHLWLRYPATWKTGAAATFGRPAH